MKTSTYRIARQVGGARCWLIFQDNELFATRDTRQEAREFVRQQRALDAEPVKVEVAWKP